MNPKQRSIRFLYSCMFLGILLATTAVGCGGGGGGGAPPTAAENTTWDAIVWDQDNWQ